MADTGNINTATMEQLKTIKNIGQIRVSLILAEREKKGHLNLTDLKLLKEFQIQYGTHLLSQAK